MTNFASLKTSCNHFLRRFDRARDRVNLIAKNHHSNRPRYKLLREFRYIYTNCRFILLAIRDCHADSKLYFGADAYSGRFLLEHKPFFFRADGSQFVLP